MKAFYLKILIGGSMEPGIKISLTLFTIIIKIIKKEIVDNKEKKNSHISENI